MALVSQRAYAKRRGISQAAVQKRTVGAGGPIPTHGPKKLIDSDEADALWEATKSAAGIAGSEQAGPTAPRGESPRSTDPPFGSTLAQARAASVVVDVQTKRLALEERRGALISRDRAVLSAFRFSRMLADALLAWPARLGPQLAAAFERDAAAVTGYLGEHIRQLVAELAQERCDF